MSDNTNTNAAAEETTEEVQADKAPDTEDTTTTEAESAPTDWEAEARKWKELSRKNEARAKENFAKAQRLDEIEEAAKSELEKAQDRAAKLEAELAESWRRAAAATYGVPEDLITGTTREDIETAAKKLQEWRGTTPATGSGVDAAGTRGEPINTDQLTREDMASMTPEQIDKARLAGRFDRLLGTN